MSGREGQILVLPKGTRHFSCGNIRPRASLSLVLLGDCGVKSCLERVPLSSLYFDLEVGAVSGLKRKKEKTPSPSDISRLRDNS